MEYNLKNNKNDERINGEENQYASRDVRDVVGDSNVTPIIKGDPSNTQQNVSGDAVDEKTGDKNVGPVTAIEETASFKISQPPNSNTNTQYVIEESDSKQTINDSLITSFPTLSEIGCTNIEQPSNTNLDGKHIESEAACEEVVDNKALSLTGVVEIASTEPGQPSNSITDVKNLAMLGSDVETPTVEVTEVKSVTNSQLSESNIDPNQVNSTKRISGAAQKRFKRLIALNIDYQEARKLCLKTWTEIAAVVGDSILLNNPHEPEVATDNKQTQANNNSGQPLINQKTNTDDIHKDKNTCQSDVTGPLAGASNIGAKSTLIKFHPSISASSKKRYKRLIRLKVDPQEASKLCVKPWPEIAALVSVPLDINQVGNDNKQIQNKSTNLATTKLANDNSGQSFNKKKAENGGIHNVKITNQREGIAPPAGSSNVGGKQLTSSEQKTFNLLIKCGLRSRAARKLCVDPERAAYIVRKFKREQRQNSQNPLPSPFSDPMKYKKSSPTGKIIMSYKDHNNMRTDSRGYVRNNTMDYQRTQSNDYGRYDSMSNRMAHVSPSSSKFSFDPNRTHPRDHERYDSTSHRMDFMDNASSSKYSDSTEYMGYPKGPPTKYMRVAPPDHVRTDPMEISPGSFRQDFLEYSESSKVKIVNRRGIMTKNQMKAIHKSLLSAIMNTEGDGAGPKFQALIPMTGWISVSCNDKQSHNWLQLNVPMLRPWSGADLLVVSGNERFATAYFPKSETESIECALRLLKVQNEGLQTDLWRVLNFREDEEGIFIEFSMDESSADTLFRLRGKVTLGFSNIHFNFIEK